MKEALEVLVTIDLSDVPLADMEEVVFEQPIINADYQLQLVLSPGLLKDAPAPSR